MTIKVPGMTWKRRPLVCSIILASIIASLLVESVEAEQSGSVEIVTDPAGDAQIAESAPSETFPAEDLRGLSYAASTDRIWMELAVAGLDTATRPLADSVLYFIDLDHGGATYRIRIERIVPIPVPTLNDGPEYIVQLFHLDTAASVHRLVADLNYTLTTHTVRIEVPLVMLRGATGLPAGNGAMIENVVVISMDPWGATVQRLATTFAGYAGVVPPETPAPVSDRMPNSGAASFVLDLPVPLGQEVYFEAPSPLRASNGGLGTYVFPLRLTNLDDERHYRILRVEGMPNGWNHAFVANNLRLAPGDDVLTQLVVEVTGVHTHGGATNFTVQSTDLDGNPTGTVQLGIIYTDIPQPAGHHPTMYFHVLEDSGELVPFSQAEAAANLHTNHVIMNTLEDDPLDSGSPATESTGEDGQRQWRISLSPSLGMGLDFDLQRRGAVTLSVASSSPQTGLPGFSVEGELLLRTKSGDLLLGDIEASPPIELRGATEFTMQFTPSEEADLIPYAPGQGLELVLRANYNLDAAQRTAGFTRANLLDGWVTLPLLEYQDPVPLGTDRDIVALLTPDRQYGNPGDVLAFQVDVTNAGTRPLSLDIEILTTTVVANVAAERINLGVGDTESLNVYVTVPSNATDGDQYATFIKIADGQVATLIGATVIATTTEDIPGVTLPGEEKGTPAMSWALVVAGLLSMAFRRRNV